MHSGNVFISQGKLLSETKLNKGKQMKYTFINYKNEIIHTEETDNPEETESFLISIGFEVGGFQLA